MSIDKIGMIQAVQLEPGNKAIRKICADAIQDADSEEKFEMACVFLRGKRIPEKNRQETRAQIECLFGSSTSVRMLPSTYFPPELRTLVERIRKGNTTTRRKQAEFTQATSEIMQIPPGERGTLEQQLHNLNDIIIVDSYRPTEIQDLLPRISDPFLKELAVKIIIYSKNSNCALVALANVSNLELQGQLINVIVESSDLLSAIDALQYVSDLALRRQIVNMLEKFKSLHCASLALHYVSDRGLQARLINVIVESKNRSAAEAALGHVSDPRLRSKLAEVAETRIL